MEDSEFQIYLSSKNSLDKYYANSASEFTNYFYPPIIFENITQWKVALRSLIMPYRISDLIESIKNPIDYIFSFTVTKINNEYDPSSNIVNDTGTALYDINRRLVVLKSTQLIQKDSKEILTLIKNDVIHGKATQPGQKPRPAALTSAQFETFFFVSEKKLILNKILTRKVSSGGIWKDIVKIEFNINKNGQNLLGLQENWYDLFLANDANIGNKKITIVSEKNVDMVSHRPNYVHAYTDIIEPIRYGSTNVNLLDVLPVSEDNRIVERKLSELIYHRIQKNNINDVSIKITNDKHEILKNHSEDVVVCLHFKKDSI